MNISLFYKDNLTGALGNADFSFSQLCTYVGQCLDIDDRKSFSNFGYHRSWPSSDFTTQYVLSRAAIYSVVRKIVNLLDIELKSILSRELTIKL